jgi:hypothetical protein
MFQRLEGAACQEVQESRKKKDEAALELNMRPRVRLKKYTLFSKVNGYTEMRSAEHEVPLLI